jgi:serine/threonine-protein kinase
MPTGRFTCGSLLRGGRSFDIVEAVDAEGRPAIVKRARELDDVGRLRFAREARLGRTLKHAGLASVLGHAPDWIAFERLNGTMPRPPAGIAPFAALETIAGTLAYLHARGVVHRDLKPAHVMFRGKYAVLIDLGVAGLVGGVDRLDTDEIVGSPAWMAPEQLRGAAPAPSADIWSFSALAHSVLNGRPLYSGAADAVFEVRRTGVEPQPDFSALADRRLADALAAGFASPAGRPSAGDLAAALARAGFGGRGGG